MENLRQKLTLLVRTEIEREAGTGWARLRRVPSTYTWQCLDHVATLDSGQQGQLADAIAENAGFHFGLSPLTPREPNPVLLKLAGDVLRTPQRHIPVRLLRGMLAAKRTEGPSGPFASLPEDVIERAEAIRPTNASQIRKEVKQEFATHFGARPENLGGGNWRYEGESSRRRFAVLMDYGGQVDQLRYWVQYQDASTGLGPRMLSYEGLLGRGFGRWDSLTADNLQHSVQLLRELIQELVAIPDRLVAAGSA